VGVWTAQQHHHHHHQEQQVEQGVEQQQQQHHHHHQEDQEDQQEQQQQQAEQGAAEEGVDLQEAERPPQQSGGRGTPCGPSPYAHSGAACTLHAVHLQRVTRGCDRVYLRMGFSSWGWM
jgi:hypothetical protein